jgi:uncharacterized membrane protein
MNKLKQLWIDLRSSFWFVPSLIVSASIGLAITLIEFDALQGDRWLARWPRLFGVGAEGARGILSTIAGSMMSVVGVTFSMTLVVLALASSQYTSRILRNFMKSRFTQSTIGIFAGIFTYCLIVLRTIRSGSDGSFVPNIAVFFSVVLAICGIGVLIFFIHHISSSIQASNIVASVTEETMQCIDECFPEQFENEAEKDIQRQTKIFNTEKKWQFIPANKSGYIQSADRAVLLRLAREKKAVVRMEHGVGEFVVQGTSLIALSLEKPSEEVTITTLQKAFVISRHRTIEQDMAFGVRQIVDVALKALSPGINDVTTAVMCIDYLTAILTRLATRKFPPFDLYEDQELRVIAKGPSFESLLDEAFDQIRSNAKGNVTIMMRMLGALQTCASKTVSPSRWRALEQHVQRIAELAEHSVTFDHDRVRIDTQLTIVREALNATPRGVTSPLLKISN